MPYFYKNKFNNYYNLSQVKSKSNVILGGAYKEIKSEEDKDKEKNTSIIKIDTNNNQKNTHKISDEKLKRFINFTI